ncbi:MAG: NADH-quinone oxidoreductase subunit N [Candidatus Omnitrophica bacterium]|nr:NADH-quinone oxidoreductase subunit N [Candidatus Omnitrophota bacterium]
MQDSVNAWWPEAILSAGALLVILTTGRRAALTITWVALMAAAAALWRSPVPPPTDVFYGFITCDRFSAAFRWIALGTTALVALMACASRREVEQSRRGEYLGLLLFIAVGLMLMAEANHLLMAYLSMEMVSLSSYLLVGFADQRRSAEAALKYLLFGALCSALMLFGMSLLFGLTGALSFGELRQASYGIAGAALPAALVAGALMLAGLAFKISMVPFHQWTPDAYEGAPIPVTALLSVGPKAAGLALLIRVLEALGPLGERLLPLLLVLTVVTMTFGNLVALVQTNVKRLLAYSTIGQVGYLLIGLVAATAKGREALLVYLAAYLFMNLGVFACALAVFHDTGSESLEAFRGLAQRAPGLSAVCAIFLLSLAGVPPLFGFVGKFLLFSSALQEGWGWVAVAAALNSAVALYYYANLIRLMYFAAPLQATAVRPAMGLRVALAVCAGATLVLGLWPAGVVEWTSRISGTLL